MRFAIHLNMEWKPTKEANEHLIGIVRNFSREGFSFASENFDLKPKETVELRLKHPQKNKFVSVSGDIVWKRQLKNRCLAGIKLRDMDNEAKSEILDYAYNRWVKTRGYY